MSLSALYQDPGLKYPDHDLGLPFSEYILKCQNLIKNSRLDLENNLDPDHIIEANSPFEFKPKMAENKKIRYGALLLHGLLDCPFVMRDVGKHLQDHGLLVRSLLLPGHGTVPGALLNVKYEDWLQTMNYGLANLSQDVDKIFLVGFSTGAALALHHALKHTPNSVVGLILLAPAIKIYSSLDFTTRWPNYISWAWERAKWMSLQPEIDYTKYQSIAFNAAYQVYRLTAEIKKISEQNSLTHPMMVVISQDDQTVSSQATINYFQQHTKENSELLIYSNRQNYVNDPRVVVRPASHPDWNISDISHVAIPIAPYNPRYGMNGDYIYASHVEEDKAENKKIIYSAYNPAQNDWFNFIDRLRRDPTIYQRLTFNPDFTFLKLMMSQFIEKIIFST